MESILEWLKFNGIKLVIAIIAGIVTYHLLDWMYFQNYYLDLRKGEENNPPIIRKKEVVLPLI